ncbi:MAG TPA: hypothetical protein VGL39_27710 [Jatrophihabitantaceae bacterium]|jgi:hypothetical protein
MSAPQQVQQPVPTPVDLATGTVQTPGGPLVNIVVATVVGQIVVWLPPDKAKAWAAAIEREASQAQTGLLLPPGVNGR